VEREFSRLKHQYGLIPVRIRGIGRVALHADLTMLARLSLAACQRAGVTARGVSCTIRPTKLVWALSLLGAVFFFASLFFERGLISWIFLAAAVVSATASFIVGRRSQNQSD
jgi:hypothetical protein